MKMKLTAMIVLLGALFFRQHASAAPQDNWWVLWERQLVPAESEGWPYGASVAVNTNGLIVVNFFQHGAYLLSTNGEVLGDISGGRDVAVFTNGLIFALSTFEVRVSDPMGNLLKAWLLSAVAQGIGIGRNPVVYTADESDHLVRAYDLDGNFLFSWGGYGSLFGQFKNPRDISVVTGVSGQEEVYVADYDNARIQVFTAEGAFLRSIPTGGQPYRIAVSPADWSVYYSDASGTDSIGCFSPDGQMRYQVDAGKVRAYRRTYLTTGLRLPNAVPVPRIHRSAQRPASTLVDVDFDILDPDDAFVTVATVGFVNGGTNLTSLVRMKTFVEGTDSIIGTNITTGIKHRLTWNAAADWSTNFVNAQIEILAKDNRGLLDFHFLTIPVPTNLAPMTISQAPVNDADFLNTWVWLIATANTNILLTNGNVMGTSGVFSGKTLTSAGGTMTTSDGRSFLFDLLNVREATVAEYNRAKGSGVKWTPRAQVGGRPTKVNEYGFDTGAATANNYWVLPLP